MNSAAAFYATSAATAAVVVILFAVPVILYRKGWLVHTVLGIAALVAMSWVGVKLYPLADAIRLELGFHTEAEAEAAKSSAELRACLAARTEEERRDPFACYPGVKEKRFFTPEAER